VEAEHRVKHDCTTLGGKSAEERKGPSIEMKPVESVERGRRETDEENETASGCVGMPEI
jgi:hypothetical protein